MMVPPVVGNGGAAHCQALFDGDVVERTTQPGLLGTVVWYSEDSDGYISAEDPDDAAAAGFVDVVWLDAPAAAEVPIAELRVVDRPFKHNDLVRWTTAENPVGRVVEVRVVVDLRMLDDGAVMKGVDTRELAKVRLLAVDDVVVKGRWVGRVTDLEEHVKVKFDAGGAVRTVVKADPETLVPGSGGGADPGLFPYYPGQRVTVASAQAMDGALETGAGGAAIPSAFPAAATVVDGSVGAVTVHWLHRRAGSTEPAPSEEQPSPRGLKPLTHLRYADWKLGDAGTVRGHQSRRCGRVVRLRTEVDVAWLPGGDGGVSTDLPSYVLEGRYPLPVERGVWPGDLVTEILPGTGDGKGGYSDDSDRSVRRTGVVQRVDAARRLLQVRWMSPATGQPWGPARIVGTDWGLEQKERMGDIGDIVMRLQHRRPREAAAAAAAAAIAAAVFGRRAGGVKVPWVGQLLAAGLDGTVSVVWSDGSKSHEKRSDVRIVPYYADDSEEVEE